MLREQTFDAGAVSLNYVEGPAGGAPLVLLHGVTSRWQGWLPVMADLALRWHVYAVDLRGHGRSGRVAGAYRVTDYAGDIIALLRQRIGEPAVVIGHSLGAMVTIAVAADAPEAVRAIVLEDPPLAAFRHQRLGERPERTRFVLMRDLARSAGSVDDLAIALAEQSPGMDAAALRARAASVRQIDPDVLTLILEDRAKEGYNLDERLQRIACPTLLLQGNVALGGALEDVDAQRAAGMLARCTTVQLPQFGHGLHSGDQGQSAIFWRMVTDFLEAL